MSSGVSGFVNAWAPSIYSTNHRKEVRNVTQGGNDLLAALPQGFQAMWAGSVMALVAEVATGPIYAVAQLFRILFHPIVSFPLSIASCAVKERFFESSVTCSVREQVKYHARGAQVDHAIAGTVSIVVDGQVRHFIVGGECTWTIENSIVVEHEGQMKRFRYHRLAAGEVFLAEDCRVVDIGDERGVRVKLDWEVEDKFTELTVAGRKKYYKLGNEVAEPVRGTVAIRDPAVAWVERHFLVGEEIPNETPDCIRIKTTEQVLHYDTGREINGPTDTSRNFVINGQTRYFASAKFVQSPSLGLSGWLNKIPRLPFQIPTRLSQFSVTTLEFVNKHMSNIIRVALLVAGSVLLFFGHTAMAAGVLLAVTYEFLDNDLGLIPKKVSLFMEKWMPAISMVGLLIAGSLISQIMAGISLLLMIPSVNLFVHQKIDRGARAVMLELKDQLIRWFVRGERPPQMDHFIEGVKNHPFLEECDAPLVERKALNAQEIGAILEADDRAYEFNPAHLTKDYEPVLQLPKNENFSELTRLWTEIGARWTTPAAYNRLFKKLVDDKKFVFFVKERFPEAKRFFFEGDWRLNQVENRQRFQEMQRMHREQFQAWVEIMARENNFANEREFIAHWVKDQLLAYVGKIDGSQPIEGEQRLLREATENTARILPFLLKPETTDIEREDALAHLAIDGGRNCALGMRRASKEVLEGFTVPLQNLQRPADPQQAFENYVRLLLQKGRLMGIQLIYKEVAARLRENEEMQDTAEDIHLYEAVTRSLKRGFYPMSEEELEAFSLSDLVLKETVAMLGQVNLMQMYQERLPDAMNFLGIDPLNAMRNRILEYLRTWVEGNAALNAQEKAALLNGALLNTPEQIADADNHPKWHRLLTVILGIRREKRVDPPPVAPAAQPVLVGA